MKKTGRLTCTRTDKQTGRQVFGQTDRQTGKDRHTQRLSAVVFTDNVLFIDDVSIRLTFTDQSDFTTHAHTSLRRSHHSRVYTAGSALRASFYADSQRVLTYIPPLDPD